MSCLFRNRGLVKRRNRRGQVLTIFILLIGLFVVGALGLLAFEVSRYSLAKGELQASVEAAALAGSATMAIYTDPTQIATAKSESATTALWLFQKNSVLGHSLSTAKAANSLPLSPGPQQALLHVAYMSQDSSGQGATPLAPDANGKILQVTGAYGVVPAFGQFLHLGNFPVSETSTAGIPMIDIMVCFDIGGAIDDQTNVTFVNRYWGSLTQKLAGVGMHPTATNPTILYDTAVGPNGVTASGTIASILNTAAAPAGSPIGSQVNAVFPQGLENAKKAPNPLQFSESNAATKNLRGTTDAGSPPGNYAVSPATPGPHGGTDTFTDLVVNLDGNTVFNGFNSGGYNFPSVAVLVEASRGNLEDHATAKAAHLDLAALGVQPQAGYKTQYQTLALNEIQPLNASMLAFVNTLTDLNKSANLNIGFITYDDQVIASGSEYAFIKPPVPNVSSNYTQAGFGEFLRVNSTPGVVSDNDLSLVHNFLYESTFCTAWDTLTTGDSDVGAAIQSSVDSLQSPANGGTHRPNANRAIIIITDSAPTSAIYVANAQQAAGSGCSGISSVDCPGCSGAYGAAQSGIPIFVVALYQPGDTTTQTEQANIFGYNGPSGTNPGGICAIAGRGSTFFQISSTSQFQNALGNINRQLNKLTQTNE